MFSFDHHLIGNTFCPRFLLIAGVLGIFFGRVFFSVLLLLLLLGLDFFSEIPCPGFSWNRANFLPSDWCSAEVWIWDENNVQDTLLVVAELCLH